MERLYDFNAVRCLLPGACVGCHIAWHGRVCTPLEEEHGAKPAVCKACSLLRMIVLRESWLTARVRAWCTAPAACCVCVAWPLLRGLCYVLSIIIHTGAGDAESRAEIPDDKVRFRGLVRQGGALAGGAFIWRQTWR